MKLFLKRAGFLLLMLVLGVLSLIAHMAGYPFAWHFWSDQSYWLPLAFGLDVLCVIAVLGLVFWGLRGFLFGRGRPWLAWFSIGVWVLVWASIGWLDASERTAHWGPRLSMGSASLANKIRDLQQQQWSLGGIKDLPEPQRQAVCSKAVLKEESRIVAEREGFPMEMHFPAEMADKGLFDADACPTELVQKYKRLVSLDEQLKASLDQEVGKLASAAAQLRLMAHPDAVVNLSEVYRKYEGKPVDRTIATKELQLRLHTNGQVQDHQWEELEGYSSSKVNKVSVDPRIWKQDETPGQDTWNFWVRFDFVDGRKLLALTTGDCAKRTTQTQLEIEQRPNGASLLQAVRDDIEPTKANPVAEEWLQKICSGKDKQVRLPDEVAKRKFGT